MTRRILIREKGETFVDLSLAQAMELQALRFCRVTPTAAEGRWRVTDVSKVGVAVIGGLALHIVPKTPLENIVYMASLGGCQLSVESDQIGYDVERSLPVAIAQAFLRELERATRRGLVKGYRTLHESAAVVRGRWDIARQLAARPGVPLPLEIEFDDFTEDVDENRILHTALRLLRGVDGLPLQATRLLGSMEVLFADVGRLPRGAAIQTPRLTRLTEHYRVPLQLARAILEALAWTHRDGSYGGGTFLVDMAAVFEAFVASRLQALLGDRGLVVTAQDRRWWLDADHLVALRPDIVVARADETVTVADTKYKVLGDGTGAIPNGDVYQAVAYALALRVTDAHLIYASGEVDDRKLDVPTAGVRVRVHAIPLAGSAEQIEEHVSALAHRLASSEREPLQPPTIAAREVHTWHA